MEVPQREDEPCWVQRYVSQLSFPSAWIINPNTRVRSDSPPRKSSDAEEEKEHSPRKDHVQDYTLARKIDRVSADDVLQTVFKNYIELSGDGKVSSDPCIRGGIALLNDRPCVVLATHKGHDANFGMANPAGYRIVSQLELGTTVLGTNVRY